MLVAMLLSVALGCKSQGNGQLRDSVKLISEQLKASPDSIPLRFKKASYNLRLGQWEYAKTEYDYIIGRFPQSRTALFYRAYANERLGRNAFARAGPRHLARRLRGAAWSCACKPEGQAIYRGVRHDKPHGASVSRQRYCICHKGRNGKGTQHAGACRI